MRSSHDNYLKADEFYKKSCANIISQDEYEAMRASFIQKWIKDNIPVPSNRPSFSVDEEQACAIGAVDGNIQVVARAGSGKTSVVVYRVLFLIKHCAVPAKSILILAFNRKAAQEVLSRIAVMFGYSPNSAIKNGHPSLPHVMTFHALAYARSSRPEHSI